MRKRDNPREIASFVQIKQYYDIETEVMNNMKNNLSRILLLTLVMALAFSLCACGNSGGKAPAELTAEEKYAVAEKMTGSSYADLVKQIGEAESSVHSARCGTAGEDYEYTYSGFVVLTYKEGDSELIEAVEKEG